MDKYPLEFKQQLKVLIDNPNFFKTYGYYTEPYPDKIVSKIAEEYKDKPFEIDKPIHEGFKKVDVDVRYLFTVKFMEDNRVVGGCSEVAFLTASIFRKMGYPAAIMDTLVVRSIFDDSEEEFPMEEHSVVLVNIDNKWWLYDATGVIKPTRFIISKIVKKGMLPGAIYRDPADIKVFNRKDKYGNLLYNLKDILLLDLQKDIINPILYKRLIKRLEQISHDEQRR